MKKLAIILCATLFLASCSSINTEKQPTAVSTEKQSTSQTTQMETSLFVNLPENYTFSSDAGGWGTTLSIDNEGNFTGSYNDSDMGDTGDGYPNGVVYKCVFNGKFSTPVKVDAYTYKTNVEHLNIVTDTNSEEIIDGVKYIYSEPYGFDNAEVFEIYLPGKPVKELSEDFLSWDGEVRSSNSTQLPHHALYNVNGKTAFIN